MGSESLEDTLLQLERRGGGAFATSSTHLGLEIFLTGSRPEGSVISATVGYAGPTLADGTPLRTRSDGRVLIDAAGHPTPEPPGFDALEKAGVRDQLLRRDWKVDGARLRKAWLVQSDADRRSLREDIEQILATISPDDDLNLVFRAPGADGGFAQVGCGVVALAAIVGGLIALVIAFLADGRLNLLSGAIGIIAGLLTGSLVVSQGIGLVVRARRLRPHAENAAILAGIFTSAIVAVIVTLLLALIAGPDLRV